MATVPNLIVAAYFTKPEILSSDSAKAKNPQSPENLEAIFEKNRSTSPFCDEVESGNALNFEQKLATLFFDKAAKIQGAMTNEDVQMIFKMMAVLGFFDTGSATAFDTSRKGGLFSTIEKKASSMGFNLERDVSNMSLLEETKTLITSVLAKSRLTAADPFFDSTPSDDLWKALDDLLSLYVAFYERLLAQNKLKVIFDQNQGLIQKVLVAYAKYKALKNKTTDFINAQRANFEANKSENTAAVKARISEMAKELQHIRSEVSIALKDYLSKYATSKTLTALDAYMDAEEHILRELAEGGSLPANASSSLGLGFFEQHYGVMSLGGFLQVTEEYLDALKKNSLPKNIDEELGAMLAEVEKGNIVVPGSGTKPQSSPAATSVSARNNLLIGASLAVLAVGGFYIFKKMKKKKRIK